MSQIVLDISGMTCAACGARIAKALSRVDGVADADVNLALERASIEIEGEVTPERLIEAVEKAGYGATLRSSDAKRRRLADAEREAMRLAEERQTLLRFAGSALLSAPLVIGNLPMMLGTGHAWIGPWTQAALAAGVMTFVGHALLSRGVQRRARRRRQHGGAGFARHLGRLLRLACRGGARQYARPPLFRGGGGRADAGHARQISRGARQARRGAALAALGRLQPAEAEFVTADGTRTVQASSLAKRRRGSGQAGRALPCDGVVRAGSSSVDEALVTGESLPVERREGDTVLTGTINGEAALEVTVTRVGGGYRLARMARLVEEAQIGDTPIQRLVDRISAIFVPVILAVAVATFLVWWLALAIPRAGLPRRSPCWSSPAPARSALQRRPRWWPAPARRRARAF